MVAKEVFFVNLSQFKSYLVTVQHAIIHVKKYWYSCQKRYLSRYLIKFIRSRGRNSELEPKEIISASQQW
jgi:hypothetical protein